VFPQLISCNRISALKANGQLYTSQLRAEKWDFLLSSRSNPAWLLLELVWGKISSTFGLMLPFPDGLESEVLTPFIAAEARVAEGVGGWYYTKVGAEVPSRSGDLLTSSPWVPHELTLPEHVAIVAVAEENFVDTADPLFGSQFPGDLDSVAERLVSIGLFVRDGTRLRALHNSIYTTITPDGKYLASSDADQLSSYVQTNYLHGKA
jgi:hypothetical protein